MPKDPILSKYLQDYITDMESDWEHELRPEELRDHEKIEELTKAIVLYVLRSRETVVGNTFREFEELIGKSPEPVSSLLDEHYTKTMLGEVPAYVTRTLELSAMQAVSSPSTTTNTYLREATRTYVLGLPQACVALTRAALEQSLKEVLGHQLGGAYITFKSLVEDSLRCNVLDKQTARMARNLAREGDEVLHEKPTDLNSAREVLIGVRGLVQQIYSAQGGY